MLLTAKIDKNSRAVVCCYSYIFNGLKVIYCIDWYFLEWLNRKVLCVFHNWLLGLVNLVIRLHQCEKCVICQSFVFLQNGSCSFKNVSF